MKKTLSLAAAAILIASVVTLVYHAVKPEYIALNRAEKLYRQDKFDKAAPLFEQAWVGGVKDRRTMQRLMHVYMQQGDFSNAVILAADALEQAKQHKESVPAASATHVAHDHIPDWLARWELARAYSYIDALEASESEYRKLLDQKPRLYRARIELANVLHWQGEHEQALEMAAAVPEEETDAGTRLLLADLYRTVAEYDAAAPLYTEYITAHPEHEDARVKYAEMLSWQGKYPESLEQYEILLQADPENVQLRRQYANVLLWSGRHLEAVEQLRRSLGETQ